MKLYHITMDEGHNGEFIARVPNNRLPNEDNTTPRVCASSTLEGCFSAVSFGGVELERSLKDLTKFFVVFEIDTEELGISDSSVIKPHSLHRNNLVEDALATNEHWISTNFVVPKDKRYVIELSGFTKSAIDIPSYPVLQLADDKHKGDYNKAYTELYGLYGVDLHVPVTIGITKLNYRKLDLDKATLAQKTRTHGY